MRREDLERWLERLARKLIEELVASSEATIVEGVVMSVGPAPYRRLDCDGRALAYVRTRPRKRAVRVDVTGLWRAPNGSRLRIPSATGVATLLVCSEADTSEAIRFLKNTVARTREARQRGDL